MNEKERAVIEAAAAFVEGIPGKRLMALDCPPLGVLIGAVDALQEPEPVRPEDVEPGTRFRFAPIGIRIDMPGVLIVMLDRGHMDCPRCWRELNGDEVFPFCPSDRIIPIKEGEE